MPVVCLTCSPYLLTRLMAISTFLIFDAYPFVSVCIHVLEYMPARLTDAMVRRLYADKY